MADPSKQDTERESANHNPAQPEVSKTTSQSISTRTSSLDESREQIEAPDTTTSSRRVSLNAISTAPRTLSSTADSPNTSARVSPQPDQSAAAYGTRSRHRGVNRPNYAEDKESEMEFEYSISRSSNNPDSKSRPSQKKDIHDAGAKKASNTDADPKGSTASIIPASKETTVAAHPPQPESRKRKAPGSSANAAPTTPSHLPTRKASSHHSSTRPSARGSNMISFEKHGRRLKDGCLIADDSKKYTVNGMLWIICIAK